jgi:anthranilate phosphoribosyltransferase
MSASRSSWFAEALPLLIEGQELPANRMADAMRALTSQSVDEAEAAAFLVALRMKQETAGEIAAAVRVLRDKMIKLVPTGPVLDTCGTGGDGSGTFNISTAVALVVAATGLPVVKHGNRSVSSRSGSADVLAELGVPIENGPAWAQRCLDRLGFAFCLAPQFHPCLAHVAPLRRKLGTRTIFNLLGPLLNPAGAEVQLIGVGRMELLGPLADAAALLGIRQACLVCSEDGLDEVSLSAATHVRHLRDGRTSAAVWSHRDFGLEPAPIDELRADGPAESAEMIRDVLAGKDGAPRWVVLANAAAAFLTAGQVQTLPEGVGRAAGAIDSGAGVRLLQLLCQS